MLQAIVFLYFLVFLTCDAHVTFTNLKCSFASKTFGEFTQCHIKAVNRTHKYISIYEKLHFKPLDNITLNIKLMRYDHGYKPFFIDLTIDGCQFLRNRRDPIMNIFYSWFKDRSNINHTCPFNHDIILDKMWTGDLDRDLSKYVPCPPGDYAVYTKWYAFKKPFADVNFYVRITTNKN